MKKIFAELSYGEPSIAVLEVEEKANTYKVILSKSVTGFYYGKFFKKDDSRIHNNLNDAFLYLAKVALDRMELRKQDYEKALENYNALADVVLKIGEDPSAPERAISELMPDIKF